MVVKGAARDLPQMGSRSLSRTAFSENLAANDPNLSDTTDYDILFNVAFSTIFGGILLVIFLVIRPKYLRLYSSNNVGPGRAVLPHRREGHARWFWTVWNVSDPQLLAWSGLDGFLFIQVLRLMVMQGLALGIPMLFVLVPLYYFSAKSEIRTQSHYYKASILNCPVPLLFIPALMSWVTTAIFFYTLYVFYRNYAILRQAYLKDPSAMSSAPLLQRLIMITGSLEHARTVASFHNRTVLIDGIHSGYDKQTLKALLDATPCGPCIDASFVSPRGDLLKLCNDRNDAVKSLEKALQEFLNSAIERMAKAEGGAARSKKADKAARKQTIMELQAMPSATLEEQIALLKKLHDASNWAELRPSHTLPGKDEPDAVQAEQKVDSISFYCQELLRLEGELSTALKDYIASDGLDVAEEKDGDRERTISIQADQSDVEKSDIAVRKRRKAFVDQTTVVSAKKYSWIRHNLKDLQLATGRHSNLAMVVMKDPKHAAIVASSAVPLSRRPFSLETAPAPAHENVIWESVQLSRAARKYRWLLGIIANIGVNLAYSPVIAILNALCSIDRLTYWSPALDEFLTQHSMFKALLTGVLFPFIMNIVFSLAPRYLRLIAEFMGPPSQTAVNLIMIDSFGAFLFFQSFVVSVLTSSVLDMLRETARGEFGSVLDRLRSSLPSKSSMFINMFIQRLLASLPMSLLRPLQLFEHMALSRWKKRSPPRDINNLGAPSGFDQGTDYPGSIIYSVQVLLAFMSFAPVNLFSSALFFAAAILVYKYALLYTNEVKHESGGVYWKKVCDQILLGLLLHHVFLLIHFTFRKSQVASVLLVPPIVAVGVFMHFVHRVFEARTSALPQTSEEDDRVDELLDELRREQESMLKHIGDAGTGANGGSIAEGPGREEGEGECVAEFVPVRQVVACATADQEAELEELRRTADRVRAAEGSDVSIEATQLITANPYCNPVLFKKWHALVVDPLLFPCLRRLSEGDDQVVVPPSPPSPGRQTAQQKAAM